MDPNNYGRGAAPTGAAAGSASGSGSGQQGYVGTMFGGNGNSGTPYHAHKIILAGQSEFFRQLILDEVKKQKQHQAQPQQ